MKEIKIKKRKEKGREGDSDGRENGTMVVNVTGGDEEERGDEN